MDQNTTQQTDFEPAALEAFLRSQFGPTGDYTFAIERISGGQSNPTYFVDFGGRRMVLRKKPAGQILRGAHAVDREYRILQALAPTGVPVPRAILYCDDPAVLGTPFYLMERLEGRVFHDTALPELPASERRGIYMGMAEAMAKLHAVKPAEIGLDDFGRPGNYFERQIARWTRQWEESPSEDIAALDELASWLPRHLPPDDGRVAIAHGDFRLGNMFFHPSKPEVIGILDWELSTLGHPLADLAFCCLPWYSAPDEYGGILGHDLKVLGIPSQQEFVEHYYAHARDVAPLSRFHIVFALFRFAVIFVGIGDRARQGNAASKNAAEMGSLARKFAKRGLDVIGGK